MDFSEDWIQKSAIVIENKASITVTVQTYNRKEFKGFQDNGGLEIRQRKGRGKSVTSDRF